MPIIYQRKYGVQTTILFPLVQADGVDLRVDAAHASGDTTIMKDEGAPANTTNAFADEGEVYSLVLTATEMQAARIAIKIVDQTSPKVWLDEIIVIETYGNASAQHPFDLGSATPDVNVAQISTDATAADRLEAWLDTCRWATAQGGGAATITLDASASATDDFYNGMLVCLSSGTGGGQVRQIIDYVGSTKVATVNEAWITQPVNGTLFVMFPFANVNLALWRGTQPNTLQSGRVDAYMGAVAAGVIAAASFAANALDAVWSTATRVLTAGTNIVLAKDTGVTGFNDLSAAQVNAEADTALADVGVTSTVTGRIDASISSRLSAAGYTAPDNAGIDTIETTLADIDTRIPSALNSGFMVVDVQAIAGVQEPASILQLLLQLWETASASATSASTVTLAGYSGIGDGVDDFWNESWLYVYQGTGEGQMRRITDWDGTTHMITVSPNFAVTPATSSASMFMIIPRAQVGATGGGGSGPTAVEIRQEIDTNSTQLASISSKIDTVDDFIDTEITDIRNRLPAALVGGRMDANVGAVSGDATAADLLEAWLDMFLTGTAQAGAAGSITLAAAGTSAVTNFYNNQLVSIVSGTGAGQTRRVTAYNGTTKIATILPNWATNPDATSVYLVWPDAGANLETWLGVIPAALSSTRVQALTAAISNNAITPASFGTSGLHVRSATAQAGTANTITLDASALATDDIYNGTVITIISGTGAGQTRRIIDYVGATKVATVSPNWVTNPASGAVFAIMPEAIADVGLWMGAVPNALQSGRVDSYVGAMADAVITAAKFAAGAFDAVWTVTTRTLTAISDSAGVTTLLSRLTAGRATNLDNLDATISSRSTVTQAQVNTEADQALADVGLTLTVTGRIDTTISSRLADADYIDPPTVAAIRSEIDANSTKLDVAVSTRLAAAGYTAPDNASIAAVKAVTDKLNTALEVDGLVYRFTANALEQAPTGGGGSTAADIWNATRATYNASGSMGQAMNTLMGQILTKVNLLGSTTVAVETPVDPVELAFSIKRGDSYTVESGRQLPEWDSEEWPDLTGATVMFISRKDDVDEVFEKEMNILSETAPGHVQLELTSVETADFQVGGNPYRYDIQATLAGGDVVTLAAGTMLVRGDVR